MVDARGPVKPGRCVWRHVLVATAGGGGLGGGGGPGDLGGGGGCGGSGVAAGDAVAVESGSRKTTRQAVLRRHRLPRVGDSRKLVELRGLELEGSLPLSVEDQAILIPASRRQPER